MKWARENAFDPEVTAASRQYGVPVALIKAIIGAESGFDPRAYRPESPRPSLPPSPDFPNGGDASIGLMQLLVRTARALGFAGTIEDLYQPRVNIGLGTRLLKQNLDRAGGDVPNAVSAYNGGWRPSLGYGSPLPSGLYGNQVYVERVMQYVVYFAGQAPAPTPSPPGSVPVGGGAPVVGASFWRRLRGALSRGWARVVEWW